MPRTADSRRVLDLLLEEEGLCLSSGQIKAALKLSDKRYQAVRKQLLDEGLVAKYACHGGGIRLNYDGRKPALAEDVSSTPTCKNIVKERLIRATTQARAKDPDSFAEKARRYLKNDRKIDDAE